jgi:hypothetical protein
MSGGRSKIRQVKNEPVQFLSQTDIIWQSQKKKFPDDDFYLKKSIIDISSPIKIVPIIRLG